MRRFLNAVFFICLLCFVAGTGIYAGYNAINLKENKPVGNPLNNSVIRGLSDNNTVSKAETSIEKPLDTAETLKTKTYTKLVFEYVYGDGSDTKIHEETMPDFLIDKSEEDFKQKFTGWEIRDFEEEKVVLERFIPKKLRQKYKISVVDGYIAVFYDESIDGSKLKEVTDTPISSLPEEEQQRLILGIEVIGQEALINLIQDFGS